MTKTHTPEASAVRGESVAESWIEAIRRLSVVATECKSADNDLEYGHQVVLLWSEVGRLGKHLGQADAADELIAALRTARLQFLRLDTPREVVSALCEVAGWCAIELTEIELELVDRALDRLEAAGVDHLLQAGGIDEGRRLSPIPATPPQDATQILRAMPTASERTSASRSHDLINQTSYFERRPRPRSEPDNTATTVTDLYIRQPIFQEPTFPYSEGNVIAERYTLTGPLGRGAFGAVWRVWDMELDREAALKILFKEYSRANAWRRFDLEKQVLARLDHPCIAKIFDAGIAENGDPFLVMELVHGASVIQYCEQRRLSLENRLQLFVAICRAVNHAHERLVLHRDLKPSNILVTEKDGIPVPKIIDFGIAMVLSGGDFTADAPGLIGESIQGTPSYMSPEQTHSGGELTVRSDVYSLGVLLFQLLTGDTPLSFGPSAGSDLPTLIGRIREAEPLAPSSAVEQKTEARFQVPARELRGDLDAITLRSTRKDPAQRYASAASLADDIERYLRSEPVLARPPSVGSRFARFLRRRFGGRRITR